MRKTPIAALRALIESKTEVTVDRAALRTVLKRPSIVFHETSMKVLASILRDGFDVRTGTGEQSRAVFCTSMDLGVDYNRAGGAAVKIPVDLAGLTLLDLGDPALHEQDRPSYKQSWYVIKDTAEERGEFPAGYDGLISYSIAKKGKVHEAILKAEVASRAIVRTPFKLS